MKNIALFSPLILPCKILYNNYTYIYKYISLGTMVIVGIDMKKMVTGFIALQNTP